MAKDVKVGDKVKFLRSHNKAVELAGTVERIDGNSVDIRLDTEHEAFETAHIDDVTVLESAADDAGDQGEEKKSKKGKKSASSD